MRRVVLAIALVACGHPKASGPKWPEPSTTADDGGESIEPQPSATYAAAIEKSADDGDKPAAAATSVVLPANDDKDKPPAGTVPAATQPTVEDVLMGEEIIIEIDGD